MMNDAGNETAAADQAKVGAQGQEASQATLVQRLNVMKILPPAPLLPTESRDAYIALYTSLHRDLQPESFLEELFVRDFTDHTWEIWRLRRAWASAAGGEYLRGLHVLAKVDKLQGEIEGRRSMVLRDLQRLRKAFAQRAAAALEQATGETE